MRELRVGIVGAGRIAGVHVNAYAAVPAVRVVAVADPVEAKAQVLASYAGALQMAGLEQIIDHGVDIISICTPPTTHAELTVEALQAGTNVLCEKPLARTLDDARLIVDAARSAPGILMIGQVARFEPDHRQAKQLIEAGHIGEVQMMSQSMTTSAPGWSEAGWHSNVELSGGPLVDLAVHSFDYFPWVTRSEPVRVHAVGADTASGPATYALVTVRYSNGALALVESSWAHPASHGFKVSTEFIGTEGRLAWDYDQINGGTMYVRDGNTSWFDPLGERGFHDEIRCFTEAVRGGATSPVSATEGFMALRTSLAAMESLTTGATIDLTTWESQ